MDFRAVVRRESELYRRWRAENRDGGEVLEIRFHRQGPDYVNTDELTQFDILHLNGHSEVRLEMTTLPTCLAQAE